MKSFTLISPLSVLLLTGCSPDNRGARVLTSSEGGYVDVTANGKRFYGLYVVLTFKEQGQLVSECSSVVVAPWDERSDFNVGLKGDASQVKVNGADYRIEGRHVCETDARGSRLAIYPAEIPIEAFKDRLSLQKTVTEIMSKTESVSSASGNHPIRMEANRTSSKNGFPR
jgi:hypothetical protein